MFPHHTTKLTLPLSLGTCCLRQNRVQVIAFPLTIAISYHYTHIATLTAPSDEIRQTAWSEKYSQLGTLLLGLQVTQALHQDLI